MNMTMLRYPGGKSRLLKQIVPRIEAQLGDLNYAEVMVGGGSIALKIGSLYPERQIILNDADADVANFWAVVSGQYGADAFEALVERVEATRGPTDDNVNGFDYWKQVKASRPVMVEDKAFRFVFLNKTTFGGQIDASPVGGLDQEGWQGANGRKVYCQYNVDNIIKEMHKCRQILTGRTTVTNLDVMAVLQDLPDDYLAYIDPPYFPGKANKLYRFEMPKDKHAELAAFLEQWSGRPWVLSYDEHLEVRRLYEWAAIEVIEANYSHGPGLPEAERKQGKRKTWKASKELIILPKCMRTTTTTTTTIPIPTASLASEVEAPEVEAPEVEAPEVEVHVVPSSSATLATLRSRLNKSSVRAVKPVLEARSMDLTVESPSELTPAQELPPTPSLVVKVTGGAELVRRCTSPALPTAPALLPKVVEPYFEFWACYTAKGQAIASTCAVSPEDALASGRQYGFTAADVRAVKLTERKL